MACGRRLVLGAVLAVATAVPGQLAEARPGVRLPYDQVAQKSIHNAYAMAESLFDQLVYFGIRNLELDLRSNPPEVPCTQQNWPTNDWFVYHTVFERRCRRLSDCLRLLRAYHDAVPEHEVITLSLELKGNDGGACGRVFPSDEHNRQRDRARQTPEGLDARLRAALGQDRLFTPADLLARCPGAATLQQAVARCGWPDVDELRGRFIVTVLGYDGVFNAGEKMIYEYAEQGRAAHQRLAFLAPLTLWPSDAAITSRPYVVFHTEVHDLRRAAQLRRRFPGHILRSAGDRGHAAGFREQQRAGLNLLMTDNVSFHVSPWSRTHNRQHYPFCPLGVVGADCWRGEHRASLRRPVQELLELRVRSDDLDGRRDGLAFLHTEERPEWRARPGRADLEGVAPGMRAAAPRPTPLGQGERGLGRADLAGVAPGMRAAAPRPTPLGHQVWTAFISMASNKDDVPARAKGCLMARASTAAGSPHVAICRHGDNRELTLHWRPESCGAAAGGCPTQAVEARLGGLHFDGEDAAFVRLELRPDGRGGVRARAAGSFDGRSYQPVGPEVRFRRTTLPLRGLAASSALPHFRTADGQAPRFLFGQVRRDGQRIEAQGPVWRWRTIGRVAEARWRDHSHTDRGGASAPQALRREGSGM